MTTLSERMKRYEQAHAQHLTRRVPVIVRVDGRAFHSLSLRKPFDHGFMAAMVKAATAVQSDAQGCRLAYTQSDEATFLLSDTRRLDSEPWFGNDLQKIVSIAAAVMTREFGLQIQMFFEATLGRAVFDARAFNLPEDEVANCFLWRARDWKRNSVEMAARAKFGHAALYQKKQPDMLAMLAEAGEPWEELPEAHRHGTFIVDGEAITLPEISHAAIQPLVTRALAREVE